MFFRSALIYRITQDLQLTAEALEAALRNKPARACASQELSTYGFVAPIGKGENAPLAHASQGCYLIACRKEERILPSSVVRDALAEKIEEIEDQQCRKVYKKERDQLKDEIVQAFLPRAFIRRKTTHAAIDTVRGLIFVDASSHKAAEDLLSTLREALGSLPVRQLSVKVAPSATFTHWIKTQEASNELRLLDRATFADTHEDGGKVVATGQDLGSDEIQNHLAAGKLVTNLALAWSDKLSFRLDKKLAIKGLRFEDLLQEQAEQDGGDDALAQADASFVLMMLTFREFVPALIEALGGEEIPQGIGADEPTSEAKPARERRPEVQVDAFAETGDETDPLYDDAVSHVRETMRASISSVQRKLKINYNRAARLIETMEEAGVVTGMNSHGAREVIAQ